MERLRLTLLCSAAATGLTHTSNRLEASAHIPVADLEEILKSSIIDWSDYPDEPRTMGTICAQSDRDSVIAAWEEAFAASIRSLREQAGPDGHGVLASHLTLFSPTRLEFYAPPLLGSLLRHDISVERVIVLIDDIYDMYARLAQAGNLYEFEADEHEGHVEKLTGPVRGETVNQFQGLEIAGVALEAQAKNLLRLLHWRRSEMIAGEELARNLSAFYGQPVPLTIFAVKHELDSLVELVSERPKMTVYVSHKITEPRRENIAHGLDGEEGYWPDLVKEVNSIATTMREWGVIAIQPTAIDELRFLKNVDAPFRLDRYTTNLADRWHVPDDTAYIEPNQDAPGYPALLTHGDHAPYSHGTMGLLQHSIYDEIAFRDHLLVSCNDGLLVYRPGAAEARISGGVEEEVAHWAQSIDGSGRAFRPAVFIHVLDELLALISANDPEVTQLTLRTAFIASLSVRAYSAESAAKLWSALIKGEDWRSLGASASSHLRRLTPGDLEKRVHTACERAFVQLLASVCHIDGRAADKVAHFVAADASASVSRHFLREVSRYLGQHRDEDRKHVNEMAVNTLIAGLGAVNLEEALVTLAVKTKSS